MDYIAQHFTSILGTDPPLRITNFSLKQLIMASRRRHTKMLDNHDKGESSSNIQSKVKLKL